MEDNDRKIAASGMFELAYKKVRELEDKIVEKPKGHEIIVLYPGINLLFNLLDGKIKEHWGMISFALVV